MVPHFTGRERECDEIINQVTSKSTRLVSIWGSPGFGKTSVAIAVGHHLQSLEIPVCFLSLRGLKSKSDLTSKFLGVLSQFLSFPNDQPSQKLSLDDELCRMFNIIPDSLTCILDNVDDLLETGGPNVKDEVIDLLEELLRRNENVTFLATTRESFEFMNVRFKGHQASRIGQLDGRSSRELVHKLLPMAGISDCKKITQICGHVPLAIKLLCSSISEEDPTELSQYLENYLEVSDDIVQMLDNPDYTSNLRLQVLFGNSFRRLSEEEKAAVVSLTIPPDNFELKVAAAVLGVKNTARAKEILKRLCRKSLLDLGSKPDSFSMHKLLQSFSREKGEQEMAETILSAKARFRTYYLTLFKTLNEKLLAGHSSSAFIEFYEVKSCIVQSLVEGCSDSEVADDAFDVLGTAEQFLDLLLWREGNTFNRIYDTALEESSKQGRKSSYRKLLVSKAFSEITWGKDGKTLQLLNEAKECQAVSSSIPNEEQGKLFCYLGMYHLVVNEVEKGIQCLHEALSLIGNIPSLAIPKLITYQILAVYYQCKKNPASAIYYQRKALQECPTECPRLVVIPSVTSEPKDQNVEASHEDISDQPLFFQVLYCVSQATAHFSDIDTQTFFGDVALKSLEKVIASFKNSLGLFSFQSIVYMMLRDLRKYEEAVQFAESVIASHQTALEQCKSNESSLSKESKDAPPVTLSSEVHEEALVRNYLDLGQIHYSKGNYSAALQSHQLALDLALSVFGQEHLATASSYYLVGWSQYQLGDYTSSLQNAQLALNIRRHLLGEDHSQTAYSYRSVGYTQHELGDYHSALQSKQRELSIRLKLYGEDDPRTADSYRSLSFTQDEIGDYTSALQSKERELATRLKVFGEEDPKTAESYRSLGFTQHQLGNYSSALQAKQQELAIRLKVFGEEHSKTAQSYHSVGVTQRQLDDHHSACQSFQHAVNVRRKIFSEDNLQTADSYHELGVTQHQMGHYALAVQSVHQALDIRLKLLSEEHLQTADSYHELGVIQHQLGHYTSAIQSVQHALDIRLKLLGEEHSKTAESYHELGVTQHQLGESESARQSFHHAFDIRLRLFGEDHAETSMSYHLLEVTQKAIHL